MHKEYESVKKTYENLFYSTLEKKYIKKKTEDFIEQLMRDISTETTLLKLPQEEFALTLISAIKKEYVCVKPEFKPNERDFIMAKYLEGMYDYVVNKKYAKKLKEYISILNIDENEFKELAVDNINLNFYCDICLILQKLTTKNALQQSVVYENISGKGITGSSDESKFRKRLQLESLNSTTSATVKDIDGYTCYIPNLIQAFKDVFFVQSEENNTQYISEEYFDIFKVLMYDFAGELSTGKIKSYRIWEFTSEEVKKLLILYKEIDKAEEMFNANKIAEFILLEKMFGLATISKLRLSGLKGTKLKDVLTSVATIKNIGYSQLTEKVLENVSTDNLDDYGDVIATFIYPLCTDVLAEVLNEVIKYINSNTLDFSKDIIRKIKGVCERKISKKPCFTQILQLEGCEETVANNIKTLMGIPSVKDCTTYNIYNYLCENMHISDGEFNKKKNAIVYDVNFADFTYSLNENFSLDLSYSQFSDFIEENEKNFSEKPFERVQY